MQFTVIMLKRKLLVKNVIFQKIKKKKQSEKIVASLI